MCSGPTVCIFFFNRAFAQELADEGRRLKEQARTRGGWRNAHVACSRFAFSSRQSCIVSPRPERFDGGRQHVFDEVRASDSGRCSCLPFLTLSTVWQNIVLLWRETEQQSDRCLGSLIDGSCKNELESIWNGKHQGDRTETQSSKITSSPGDSDSLSEQF